MSTALTIFVVCLVKGVLLSVAYNRGWIRSPEQVGKDRMEEKAVLRAYREWRKNAGSAPSADPRIVHDLVADPNRKVGPIRE